VGKQFDWLYKKSSRAALCNLCQIGTNLGHHVLTFIGLKFLLWWTYIFFRLSHLQTFYHLDLHYNIVLVLLLAQYCIGIFAKKKNCIGINLDSILSVLQKKMGGSERCMVFVTVGTTCFDALVKAVDSEEVKDALLQKGYTHLVIQMGRGTYVPTKVTIFLDNFDFS
jgi:hypothetical protein